MPDDPAYRFADRELSWLAFNGRVLQEAQDPSVPLFERLFFLGVFSSNLDEFFRVRVASLRSLLREGGAGEVQPRRLLSRIQRTVTAQQEAFGQTLGGLRRELEVYGLRVAGERAVRSGAVSPSQAAWLRAHFEETIRPHLDPVLAVGGEAPFLKDRGLYLIAELWPAEGAPEGVGDWPRLAFVEVPSPPLPRFVTPPAGGDGPVVLFLDDVIRLHLPRLFGGYDVGDAYAVKLSRDAELYLDERGQLDEGELKDEFGKALARRIRRSLPRRQTGLPCRFLYDQNAPFALLERLKRVLGLASEDLLPGGRYHNLHDLQGFPRCGLRGLSYEPMPPLPHPELSQAPSVLAAVAERDRLLHVPYQRFDSVLRFLDEAATDPAVEAVWITLYRVAESSAVVEALIRAAERGKQVTAFVEAKARFDEARNLASAERMEAAGVRVLYSKPKLKVHAKLALVARREAGGERLYAYLSTGNFNERTARVYADLGLFTADPRLTEDVQRVFRLLEGERPPPPFEHLLVAPHAMRDGFYRLIEAEAARAQAGQDAWMLLKMNALEDEGVIRRLYSASQAGVRIRLVVRGICRLVPGVEGLSETIEATSIVDRFLEHARVYVFGNGGEPALYLASADWMRRNLSRRIEVAFPVYDERLRRAVLDMLDLQCRDAVKARTFGSDPPNAYVPRSEGGPVRAQVETYRRLNARLAEAEREAAA